MSSQTQHYLDAIDPMASRFIRGKVRQLIRYRGFSPEDREDLFHDFAFDLLQRKEHFDPTAGTWEAFVIVVCENRFAALLEHRCAQKRSDRSEAGSLNDPVEDEGLTLSLGDTLPETQRFAHTRRSPRPPEEAADLQLDVASVIASLPPHLRDLCERLKRGTVSDAARATGAHRPSVYDAIRVLRERFEDAGMRDYL